MNRETLQMQSAKSVADSIGNTISKTHFTSFGIKFMLIFLIDMLSKFVPEICF